MEENPDSQYHFAGFASPTTTPVPDQLFDELLYHLSPTEIVVLLYIIRRTYGFKKSSDNISLNQMVNGIVTREGKVLDKGTGLSKATVARSLKSLEEKGVIERIRRRSSDRGDEPTTYQVKQLVPVSHSETRGVSEVRQAVSQQRDTQETVLQQTEIQETDPSSIRKGSRSQGESQNENGAGESDTAAPSLTGSFGTSNSFHEEDEQPAIPWAPRSEKAVKPPTAGFQSVGDVIDQLGQNNASTGRTTRQSPYSEERQRILAYIEDFAIEMGDEAPLQSSVSRAYNLYARSGVPIEAFTSLMYEARALTKEYTANIKKTKAGKSGPFGPQKNKMAYFFSILESRLGLAGGEERAVSPPK